MNTAQTDIAITPIPGVKIISARIWKQHASRFPEEKKEPILDMYFSLQGNSSALNEVDGTTSRISSNQHA